MEIELVTTKKKLTKSLVAQMQGATLEVLQYGFVLGYMIQVKKEEYKTILIRHDGKYYTIAGNWLIGADCGVYRVTKGHWSTSLKFDTNEQRDEWWRNYCHVMDLAKDQIYI